MTKSTGKNLPAGQAGTMAICRGTACRAPTMAWVVVGVALLCSLAGSLVADPARGAAEEKGAARIVTAIEVTEAHDDYSPTDLHSIAVTVAVWEMTRVWRIVDAVVNVVTPFGTGHPVDGTVEGIRVYYHKWGLSRFRPTRRVGDLFKALYVRELSLADLSTAAQLKRVQGIIDWVQLVFADLNDLMVFPVGIQSRMYLQYPYWPIDQVQYGVDEVYHKVNLFLTRLGYNALLEVEGLWGRKKAVRVEMLDIDSFRLSEREESVGRQRSD